MIKKFLTAAMVTMSVTAFAQNVGVNGDGTPPDVSAMLDIKSTDKGVLIPRMTQSERNNITNPATGLLVFQTDNTAGFYYNSGTPGSPVWVMISNATNLEGTQNGVLVGQGVGTPSTFSAASTNANQVLATPTAGGAPTWVDPITTLTTTDITAGSGVVVVNNGAGTVLGSTPVSVDVQGTLGGVMYGQGTGVGATFTGAATAANQVLATPTLGGAPAWVNANSTLTTTNISNPVGSTVLVTNGTGQVLGSTPVSVDVRGTQGGVMYGTGAGTSALFSAAGTTGQYLRSNGTAAPAFATPKGRFSITANHYSGGTALVSGTGSLYGGPVTITNVASPVGLTNYFLMLGSFYQATSNVEALGCQGWIYTTAAGTGTSQFIVTLYKITGLFGGACSATYPSTTTVGAGSVTALGSCTVNFTAADYAGKYSIDISGSPVALAPGDALILHIVNNSGASRIWYGIGTADLRGNVQ
jgi:hypothetical protein